MFLAPASASLYNPSSAGSLLLPFPTVVHRPDRFALLKHYRSLIPMAQEASKPMFSLKPTDGALGAHPYAVQDAYSDFKALTAKVVEHTHIAKNRGGEIV